MEKVANILKGSVPIIMFLAIFLFSPFLAQAAINDDLKKATSIALNKINAEKERCFKDARFSAVANECIEDAYNRQKTILDVFADIRLNKIDKSDSESALNSIKDQIFFEEVIDACDKLDNLSSPNNKYYYIYECKLINLNLYFQYL